MYLGFSSFAATNPNFPCSRFLRIQKASHKPFMTILYSTFGDDYSCVARFLEQSKTKDHLLQIHLSNETFRRWRGRGTEHEMAPRMGVLAYNNALKVKNPRILMAIRDRVRDVQARIAPLMNQNTQVIISTGLEDNYDTKAYYVVKSQLRRAKWPFLIGRNPLASCDVVSPSDYCELHSTNAYFSNVRCIWNNDGNAIGVAKQSSMLEKYGRCFAGAFWSAGAQGVFGGDFILPRSRHFRISRRDVNEYRRAIHITQRKLVSKKAH